MHLKWTRPYLTFGKIKPDEFKICWVECWYFAAAVAQLIETFASHVEGLLFIHVSQPQQNSFVNTEIIFSVSWAFGDDHIIGCPKHSRYVTLKNPCCSMTIIAEYSWTITAHSGNCNVSTNVKKFSNKTIPPKKQQPDTGLYIYLSPSPSLSFTKQHTQNDQWMTNSNDKTLCWTRFSCSEWLILNSQILKHKSHTQ